MKMQVSSLFIPGLLSIRMTLKSARSIGGRKLDYVPILTAQHKRAHTEIKSLDKLGIVSKDFQHEQSLRTRFIPVSPAPYKSQTSVLQGNPFQA